MVKLIGAPRRLAQECTFLSLPLSLSSSLSSSLES